MSPAIRNKEFRLAVLPNRAKVQTTRTKQATSGKYLTPNWHEGGKERSSCSPVVSLCYLEFDWKRVCQRAVLSDPTLGILWHDDDDNGFELEGSLMHVECGDAIFWCERKHMMAGTMNRVPRRLVSTVAGWKEAVHEGTDNCTAKEEQDREWNLIMSLDGMTLGDVRPERNITKTKIISHRLHFMRQGLWASSLGTITIRSQKRHDEQYGSHASDWIFFQRA